MADDTTKISTLPLSENLDDDDLLLVVEDGVSKKAEVDYLKTKFTEDLATVASSGSYNDLSNRPTIPDEQIQSDWNQASSSAKDYIKNKPTIPSDADDIGYDNTESGLTATDVQAAIDELAQDSGGGTAATTTYDNTSSGLTADDVQEAIDEVVENIEGIKYVEYSSKSDILNYYDLAFENATDGMLQSNGTVSGSSGYCVSDYIPLNKVSKLFRHNVSAKYYLEAYALYDSSKNMISGTYHARTTSYEYTTYLNYSNVLFYDISAQEAAYIRITKDKSYSFIFTEEINKGKNYIIEGDINANNIYNIETIVNQFNKAFNNDMLTAKSFVVFRSDRDITYSNTYLNPSNGSITTSSSYSAYITSDYIEVKPQTLYASGINYSYACYDADKTLLSYGILYSSDSNLRGTDRYWFFTTPAKCEYMRICSRSDTFGLQEVPTKYEVLCLGDSIFGVNPACFDISTIAQEKTGYNIANSGFGGSQASSYSDSSSPYYSFNLWKLVDAIYDDDFSEQETSAETIQQSDGSILYVPRLTILKSVNFSKIKLITIAYGTNDCSKNVALDNDQNKYDKTTYCGALRYSIEKLWSKYPNIMIAFFAPPYGRKGTNNEYSTDEWTNGINLHLTDYVEAMKDVADEYHIPVFDHYSNMGVNDYNWGTYLRDGTHLSFINGANMFGAKVGQEINGLLTDI